MRIVNMEQKALISAAQRETHEREWTTIDRIQPLCGRKVSLHRQGDNKLKLTR